MDWLTDRWDIALMAIAVYVAVMSLVRMMARRQDQVVADVERQLQAHRNQTKPKPGKTANKKRDAA